MDGYNLYGYNKHGLNIEGLDSEGYNKSGFKKQKIIISFKEDKNHTFSVYYYDRKGYDTKGFDRNGFNSKGYNHQGYNKKGLDLSGFDTQGWNNKNINKFTNTLYDSFGFDINNKHKETKTEYYPNGFNKFHKHKDTQTRYNPEGYNKHGYNINRYNKLGYNEEGYNKNGFNSNNEYKEEADFNKRVREQNEILKAHKTFNLYTIKEDITFNKHYICPLLKRKNAYFKNLSNANKISFNKEAIKDFLTYMNDNNEYVNSSISFPYIINDNTYTNKIILSESTISFSHTIEEKSIHLYSYSFLSKNNNYPSDNNISANFTCKDNTFNDCILELVAEVYSEKNKNISTINNDFITVINTYFTRGEWCGTENTSNNTYNYKNTLSYNSSVYKKNKPTVSVKQEIILPTTRELKIKKLIKECSNDK